MPVIGDSSGHKYNPHRYMSDSSEKKSFIDFHLNDRIEMILYYRNTISEFTTDENSHSTAISLCPPMPVFSIQVF